MMLASSDLAKMFFHDLKQYNPSNFKTLSSGDVKANDPVVNKAFSSVITRYFIFVEKHPELTPTEVRVLYYKLKLDMIARYFSNYPDWEPVDLAAFQQELNVYVLENKGSGSNEINTELSI